MGVGADAGVGAEAVKHEDFQLLCCDVLDGLRSLPSESVHTCVTSPPYFALRDYGVPGQIGLEKTPQEFLCKMVAVFEEVRRVLRKDGTLWLNIGDSYARTGGWSSNDGLDGMARGQSGRAKSNIQAGINGQKRPDGLKEKDLMLMPARIALALQDAGWWVRSEIIWNKPAPMPESVTDRPTCAHEKIFLLTRSASYFYDADAVREPSQKPSASDVNRDEYVPPEKDGIARKTFKVTHREYHPMGRNLRNVWTLPPAAFAEAHFATFPPSLPKRCILAGTSERGCCPHCGKCWRRVVETVERAGHKKRVDEKRHKCGSGGHASSVRVFDGWQPACTCPEHQPIPCTVLDCFLGSGTTLMVAAQLGRRGCGIELNPEYLEMAKKRIYGACGQEVMVF